MTRRRKIEAPAQPPQGGGQGLAHVVFQPLDEVRVAKRNPKGHDIEEIKASIKRFGFIAPLLRNEGTDSLVAGHGRLETLKLMRDGGEPMPPGLQGDWEVPVIHGLKFEDEREAEAYIIADNRLVEKGGWDADLREMLIDIAGNTERALEGVGYSQDDLDLMISGGQPTDGAGTPDNPIDVVNHGALSTRFLVPPFTVLNARDGWWSDRKRLWLSLGIKSEEGRDGLGDTSASEMSYFNGGKTIAGDSGSVFDPVLCELAYSWFCPTGGKVLDPFAGGSVRGVVAAKLGRHYLGNELRGTQVEANRRQWQEIAALSPSMMVADTPPDFMPELTPVEEHGGHYVKRDDLYCVAGVRGGKVRTCWHLCKDAKGLVTAGSRASPQVNIVAHMAARLGVPCRVHTPTGELSPEVQAAQDAGAEVIQHKPGHNSVIVARAREDAKAQGYTEIPFGMECQEAIEQTRKQVANLPFSEFDRIVVPVGSGMSLAGILWGLLDVQEGDTPVLGVMVGADPTKRLDKFAPKGWREMVTLVPAGVDYHEHLDRKLGDLVLDAHYEAKAVDHLEEGDLFWVIGIRQTQADVAMAPQAVEPQWTQGDSAKLKVPKKPDADMVFSCPPYADLEVYSDDPADISNMPYDQFLATYREIIRRAVARLKPNRFAVWVVGEVRDAGGNYRNFVGDTVQAFKDAGADFYNEAILVTPAGTLPLRAGRQFAVGRKLGKCHQNVLVFVKGDGKEAARACGDVVVHVPGDQPAGDRQGDTQ